MVGGDWVVRIVDVPGHFARSVYIYARSRSVVGSLDLVQSDGTIAIVKEGSADIKPTIVLQPEMLEALFTAMIAAGLKPKDAGKIEGLYEAQSEHLADLRHLLKLDQVTNVRHETAS